MKRLQRSRGYKNWKKIYDMDLWGLLRLELYLRYLEWYEKHIREWHEVGKHVKRRVFILPFLWWTITRELPPIHD